MLQLLVSMTCWFLLTVLVMRCVVVVRLFSWLGGMSLVSWCGRLRGLVIFCVVQIWCSIGRMLVV